MKRTIYIYDNDRQSTGVYVSDKFIRSYRGGDCEEVVVEIPDELEPYETDFEDTMVKLGEFFYPLSECLRIDKRDRLYLMAIEPGTHPIWLKVVERVGRKSLSFTI